MALVISQEIRWEERLRNDLWCVQWDVKPFIQSINNKHGLYLYSSLFTKMVDRNIHVIKQKQQKVKGK